MFKKLISLATISILLGSLSVNASQFGIDQNLSVSPTSDTLDFGTVEINESKSLEFTFTNSGSNNRSLYLLDSLYPPFYTSQGEIELNANTSNTLSVEFKPSKTGQFKQIFKVKEVYTNEIKTLTIEGEVEETNNTTDTYDNLEYGNEIYFYPEDELIFPDTVEDFSGEMIIAISNYKDSTEKIKVVDEPNGAFDLVSSDTIYIDEDETEFVNIRFEPSNDTSYTDSITFEDEDGNRTTIDLEGEGINSSDEFEFQIPVKTINPEANQKAFFNFYLDRVSDLDISIEDDSGHEVYSEFYSNISSGRKDRRYYWDGDDDGNDQVEDGTYYYTIEISNYYDSETYTGSIEVNTDIEEGLLIYRRVEGFPLYPTFSETRPQDIDPITTNESLIYRLKASPEYTETNDIDIDISFENTKDGKATVRVYDENLSRKLTIDKDDSLNSGYHKNIYTWDETEFSGKDADDGKYLIKVTFTSDDGEVDTDVVYVNLNRDGELESDKFNPPYPNYDNSYQEYYQEFEENYGYTPNCSIMSDVPENSYTCAAAKFVFDKGVITGNYINDSVYLRPNDPLTRAEALTIVLRVMGMELEEYDASKDGNLGFKDLNSKEWYAPYVKTMIKTAKSEHSEFGERTYRILTGYADGTLRPNNEISRVEFYKIFLEAAQQSDNIRANFNLNYDLNYDPYLDVKARDWHSPYTDFVKQYLNHTTFVSKYFNTYKLNSSSNFYPNAIITRQEVMELLYETERLKLVQF